MLAPMTRCRATHATLAPDAMAVEYYRQRATRGGLLITEATHISAEATPIWTIYRSVRDQGGDVPGIWTDEQTRRWRDVTEAVHGQGALISCQLLHAGRVAQPEIGEHPLVRGTAAALPSVSSSTVPLGPGGEAGDYSWDRAAVAPRALEQDDIARIRNDYQLAAVNALRAGFDAVELHAGHGYLVDQFLCDGVNQRRDRYGGSIENRCRFLLEVVESLVEVVGADRVGVRLSPQYASADSSRAQTYFGATCSDPDELYGHAIAELDSLGLSYLLLTEPRVGGLDADPGRDSAASQPIRSARFRSLYRGALIGAGGFTPTTAAAAVANGSYDAIAFGRWFISNPDLPDRLRRGLDLNVYDRTTFYGRGAEGYIDYPTWDMVARGERPNFNTMPQSQVGATLRG